MKNVYYIAPSQRAFDDLYTVAKGIRQTYDDTHWYATAKINQMPTQNIEDNFMYIWQMFDVHNQEKILQKVSVDTHLALLARTQQS